MRTIIRGLSILLACAATPLPLGCGIRSEVGHIGADAMGVLTDGGAAQDGVAVSDRPDDAAAPSDGDGGKSDGGGAADAGGVLAACTSDIATRVPPAPLRRLRGYEYQNTVRDLLGLRAPDTLVTFDRAGLPGDLPQQAADAYHDLAHELALEATRDATAIGATTKCDVMTMNEAACLDQVLNVVSRLLRQPLDASDVTEWRSVFAEGRALGGDLASGVRAVLEVALQSPELLYRVELGEMLPGVPAPLGRPRPFEMAARLSYLLWGSAPDDLLWQAATADRLTTKSDVESHARRLLADARAREPVRHFYLDFLNAPVALAPADPTALGTLFRQETAAFVDEVVWNGAGDLKGLLTAPFGFVNQRLAEHYGIPGIVGNELRKVAVPAGQRRGFLTQGAFLSGASTMTRRGLQIAQRFLCGPLEKGDLTLPLVHPLHPPPADGQTVRQHIEQLTGRAECSTCHRPLDATGFAFSHYDGTGKWMETERGLAIDARGEILTGDAAGSFDGALELAQRLANSRDVLDCHADQWMKFAYGRDIVAADACSREFLQQSLAKTGGNIPSLMISLTQTEAFLYRPAP